MAGRQEIQGPTLGHRQRAPGWRGHLLHLRRPQHLPEAGQALPGAPPVGRRGRGMYVGDRGVLSTGDAKGEQHGEVRAHRPELRQRCAVRLADTHRLGYPRKGRICCYCKKVWETKLLLGSARIPSAIM